MLERIKNLGKEIEEKAIENQKALEEFRIHYLGRKGVLAELFESFKLAANEEKKQIGKELNELKQKIQEKYDTLVEKLSVTEININNEQDLSLPAQPLAKGSRHPLSLIQNELISTFMKLGFSIADGPEIEDDWHNFSALNFPENHPARDMQDTFFVEKEIALRTHTTSVQVRLLEKKSPPIKVIMPGRVYRNEAITARANCFFHQIDGVYIDRNVSFADLKQTMYYFVQELFGKEVKIRFRPSYFPFTEPSAEMDIDCRICKGKGCNVCKYSG
ncbi:MAG: phenylalanine--tRNA ligase subunit alpha, partial [Bacteroidia bacterium]|nr:phenylalanine--tRNA ligase subunit alpha [Bacteroidia bacterium]